MEFRAYVTDQNIYKKYVGVLNSLFGLSERAMDIFASLLRIQSNWGIDEPFDITDTRSRKQIMRDTLVNKNNLSKYLRILRDNKILVYNKDKDGWIINSNLVPVISKNTININFTLQKNNE